MGMRTVVVTGATGKVGGQVVAQLAGTGVRVRAVGRDGERLAALGRLHGVEPFAADLGDAARVREAAEEADAVFLVFPSVVGDGFAAEAVAALTVAPRVVYLSAMGLPDDPDDDPGGILGSHVLLERLVRESAREWTFLRSGGMAGNTLGWAEQIRRGDELRWFGPHVSRPLVHEADLAAVGVRALLESGHHGASYELSGPEHVTQERQLADIAAAVGRPLRFVDVGADRAPALFVGAPAGMAEEIVRGHLAMADDPEPVTGEVERLLGRPGLTFAQWARDHADDFR